MQSIFFMIKYRKDWQRYGEDDAVESEWGAYDHAAHVTCQILRHAGSLPENPQFGPFQWENVLESWNQAYGLMETYHWLKTRNRMFFKRDEHDIAVVPYFTTNKCEPPPEKPTYHPFKFFARWVNKDRMKTTLPKHAAQVDALPVLLRVPDPRTAGSRHFRDYVRRTLDFPSLGLDLQAMILNTPVQPFSTHDRWGKIEKLCRAGSQDADFEGFEFQFYTQTVPSNGDIFESEIVRDFDGEVIEDHS